MTYIWKPHMLAVAAVHPKGEDDGYDGLYFRDSEMGALADGMRGLPVLVEHNSKPVGQVLHAFKGTSDQRLYAVFETDTDTFGGCLAGSLIKHGLTGDVSLGHECKIQSSADGTQQVIGKVPTELSICEQGAREKTHIYAKTQKKPNKRYIKLSDSQHIATTRDTMTDPSQTTPANAPTSQIPPSDTSPDMVRQLLEQVKALTETHTKISQENSSLKDANAKFAVQVEKTEAVGKRKREAAIDGSIKEFFESLMSKYESELKPHEEQLDGMFEGMKNNVEAEPMIQALSCAAAAAAGSITELESQYQANKKLKIEIDALQLKLLEQGKPMFANKQERVVTETETVTAQASISATPAQPKTFQSIFSKSVRTPATLKGAGMRETNPQMWEDLMQSAPRGRGMPKIDAFISMIQK